MMSITLVYALLISIHAPARGATDLAYVVGEVTPISIHAPARGATAKTHKQLI